VNDKFMSARTVATERSRLRRGKDATSSPVEAEIFSTSEQVLLCCFGATQDASTTRTSVQLRQALVAAGFRSPAARHLVRTTGLLRATTSGRYAIRHVESETGQLHLTEETDK
jgi:hypothetical protein